MPKFTYKTALATAVTLATLVASPGTAAAASAPQPEPLKAHLLTKADMPPGYEAGDPSDDWSNLDRANLGNVCSLISTDPAPGGERTHQAMIFFTKGKESTTIVLEMVAITGDKKARAAVTATAAAPKNCASTPLNDGGDNPTALNVYPLAVSPQLGDAAAGIRFALTSPNPADVTHGKEIVIARHGVTIAIFVVGVAKQTRHDLDAIAAAAVRKF
jgi:hypothetical protein